MSNTKKLDKDFNKGKNGGHTIPLRELITKDEAREQLIEEGTRKSHYVSNNKLCEFLSQDNVKDFNTELVKRNFSREYLKEVRSSGFKLSIDDPIECAKEVDEFFDLCKEHDIIPTVASLSVYLRTSVDTIMRIVNEKPDYPVYPALKQAINTIQGIQEMATSHGVLNPVLFMFLGKQYHGFRDNMVINYNNNVINNTGQMSNTLRVIQEQLSLEKAPITNETPIAVQEPSEVVKVSEKP